VKVEHGLTTPSAKRLGLGIGEVGCPPFTRSHVNQGKNDIKQSVHNQKKYLVRKTTRNWYFELEGFLLVSPKKKNIDKSNSSTYEYDII